MRYLKFARPFLSTAIAVASFSGPFTATAENLLATQKDFSATAQGVGGLSYGYYLGTDSTTGAFSTDGMTGGTFWVGNQGDGTPAHEFRSMHPGAGSTRSAVVRRYTVGSNGEPAHSGTVRIAGRFFDIDQGDVTAFVILDPDGDAGPAPRSFLLPPTAVAGPSTPVPFDLTAAVSPGATIDFGALPGGSGNSDSTGFFASISTEDTPIPTAIVANSYNSTNLPVNISSTDHRGAAAVIVTDGILGATDETSFDTLPGTGFPYQFAGLLYLENPSSGKATRFDSVRIDSTTSADFAAPPQLYILRKNIDPGSSNPAADDRYARLPVVATRIAANAVGQPYYTFDLTSLPDAECTGYGFAVVGPGIYNGGSIAVSEMTAQGERVSDAAVIAPQPFWVEFAGNRYGFSVGRGFWTQMEAEAQTFSAHLVAINSAAENQFLVNAFGGTEVLYIGLSKPNAAPVTPASYSWSTGQALTYENWLPSQPDDFQDSNDYIEMNYGGPGLWANMGNEGFPAPGGNYRGVVEIAGVGAGERNFSVPEISAKSNVFDAGSASPTQGGVLPPSINVSALNGGTVTFPQVVGLLNTAAHASGPEGSHAAGISVDLTTVGGISGYRNGNNSPSLVGVFLADQPPATAPVRLDFSTSALGEDFEVLAPELGQVFFIGDGISNATGGLQKFIVPGGATRLFFGFPDGNNGTLYHGAPAGYGDNSGTIALRATGTLASAPVITTGNFPNVGSKLTAAGGTAPYSWQVFSGNFPPHLILYPDGTVDLSGQPAVNGTYTFTVRATDAASVGISVDKQFTIVVANPVGPQQGIAAWWPGDDAIVEVIGGRHGSLKNGASFATGKVGRAFNFDGIDDIVVVADHDSLDITGDLTIEAWVNANATSGERTIVSKRSADNADVTYVFFVRDGILRFATRSGGGIFQDIGVLQALPAGLSHVAVTVTNGTARLFVNGVEAGSGSVSGVATNGPLTIGATITDAFPVSAPNGAFSGVIDELTIYNHALTNAEVAAIFSAGSGGKARSTISREIQFTTNVSNQEWQYGSIEQSSADQSTFTLYPSVTGPDANGAIAWISGDGWLSVSQNLNNTTLSTIGAGGTEIRYAPRQVALHPSNGSMASVVRWKVPKTGRYAISANFIGIDARPTSTVTRILQNSQVLDAGNVDSFLGDGFASTRILTLQAGEPIDFVVGPGGNGGSFDNTSLSASAVFLGSTPAIDQTQFPVKPSDPLSPWRLTASGGTGPYTFAVTLGTLPAGITIEADGDIIGDLTTIGRSTFTVEVTDSTGLKGQQEFELAVALPIAPPRSLAGWFPGELHAHDVIDSNLGLESPGTTFVPGKSGRAFHFDGVGGSVEVNSADLNAVPLTMEAWVKPEVRNDGSAADFFPTNVISGDRRNFGGHGIGVNVFPDGSHMWIEVQGADEDFHKIPNVNFAAGKWAHVAVVLTPGNAKTYVNGALVDDFSFTQAEMDADDLFRIGRHNEDTGYGNQRFFKGAIDEVSIYHRALTAEEIVGIYNADGFGKNRDDAARDFFADTNAEGQRWQYGQMDPGASPNVGSFARFTTVGTENAIRYWRNGGVPDPNVVRNIAESDYFHWVPGRLSVHPGPGGHYSAARWTAPEAGSYAVFAQFVRLNAEAGDVSVHARHNGVALLGSSTLNGPGARTQFTSTISAAAGDTVDFIVGNGSVFGYDATGLTPSIVKLATGPEFTDIDFPTPSDGTFAVDGALTANGDGPFNFSLQSGNLPTGLTLRPDGVVKGTLKENGTFTFVIKVTDVNGLTASKEFSILVVNVPPPPPFTPAESLTFKANGKLIKNVAGKPTPEVRQDSKFRFDVVQKGDSFASNLRLNIQYSATPADDNSWQNLPDSRLDRKKDGATAWYLDTLRMPAGENFYFRVRTTADGYSPAFGPALEGSPATPIGPITILPTPVMEVTLTATTDSDDKGKTVHPDEQIFYYLTVKNIGSAAANELVYGMKIPKNTQYENVLQSQGTFESLPKGKGDKYITSVQWRLPGLAPGAQAKSRFFVDVKRDVKFGTILKADGAFVTYKGKIAAAEVEDRVVNTELIPPLTLTLEPITTIAPRGGAVLLKMTARNDASYDARECKAFFRLPNGARVLYMAKKGSGQNFDDFSNFAQDPQESINPSLTPFIYGAPQVIRWDLGTIPGTDTAGSATARTRELNFILEVKHDVLPTQLINGVHVTTSLSMVGWNLFFTPPSGGSIPVFANGGPEKRVLISAEDLFDPPILGLEKSSKADTIFRGARVKGDETFVGDVTGVLQGNSIFYRLHYKNSGNSPAHRSSILERIPDGVTFQGFIKISRTGREEDEEEIPFNAFRFYDKKGKLISGEPYFDSNSNGRYDLGEPYTDYTKDEKFTPAGDIRAADWVRFDLGTLDPGASGYVAYRCAATAAVDKEIKSEGYSLVSESLHEPITGTPRATYARIVKGLSFQVQNWQSTTSAAPFDNPERPQDSEIITEAEVRNTGDLRASTATIELDIPLGLEVQSAKLLDNLRNDTGVVASLKNRTVTWLTSIPVGEKRIARVVSRVLPSAQLPAAMRKLDTVFAYPLPRVDGKYNPLSATRFQRLSSGGASLAAVSTKPVTASAEGQPTAVTLRQPNRAEVWAFKSAPLSQESRKNIRYLFVVGNSGNVEARNVEAAFFIPPGTTFVEASAGATGPKKEVVRWKLGNVAAHSSVGLWIDVNIAHLDTGMVKDNSFVVTSENSPEVVPFVTRTSVRQRPFHNGIWEWFSNAVGALGINVKGPGSTALQEELNTLTDSSRTHVTRFANIIWTKTGFGIIPNGDGQVVVIGPTGGITGGTVLTEGQGTSVVGGSGASITARGVGTLTGSLLISLVEQIRTRSDKNAPSMFVSGNGRLIYYTGDQLINNDTGAVVGSVTPKAGTSLVAAGGLNMVAAGGGHLVAAGGLNANQLVAAGGGNLVAAGGLNLVAAGGGNVTATAGGNLVAAGGLNLVAAGGGNVLSHNGSTLVAAGGLNNAQGLVAAGGLNFQARLVGNDGASLVGNDGASLVGNDGASLIGNDGGTLIGNDGATLIGNDGGTLVAAGAGN